MLILPAWAETLGWMLVHSLWQGTLLAGGLWLVLRALPPASATARYTASCACFAAMLLFPVVTELAPRPADPAGSTSAMASREARVRGQAASTAGAERPGPPPAADVRPFRLRVAEADAPLVHHVLLALVTGWLLGVAVRGVRLLGGWGLTWRLGRAGVHMPPPEWIARMAALCRAMRVRQRVRLLCSDRVRAPVLLGLWRPLVLVPTSALTGLPAWQLELLLRHELTHLRRLDHAVNLLQTVAEVLLFHHPATGWVSARIRHEREHCCDDAVAAEAGRSRYVRALVAMEELRATMRTEPHAFVLGADGGSLLSRVQRLIGGPESIPTTSARLPAELRVTFVLGALLVVVALGTGLDPHQNLHSTPTDSLGATAQVRIAASGSPLQDCVRATDTARTTLCDPLRAHLTAVMQERHYEGSVVVQDVVTGALVAYAVAAPDGQQPLTQIRAPGSIWKLSLAAIWWEHGLGDRRLPCPQTLEVGGRTIRHLGSPQASMSADEMLVTSCNTAAARMALELRDRLGADGMRAALARFGFRERAADSVRGRDRDVTFWATSSSAWRRSMSPEELTVRVPATDDDAGWAALAMGLEVELSPLHIARFLQAIANDGVMLQPTAERRLALARSAGTRVMSAGTAKRLRAAMRRVVATGTASDAQKVLVGSRWSLGGKTGTIPSPRGGREDGWFAGLVFDDQRAPRYVVVVHLIRQGRGGGAAATFAASLTRALGGIGDTTLRNPS